jgi:hypothetical protein
VSSRFGVVGQPCSVIQKTVFNVPFKFIFSPSFVYLLTRKTSTALPATL